MKGVRKGNRKTGLTKLVNMDRFTSFSKATLTQALDLNNIVIIRSECQLHCSFVGGDCVHVIIAMAPVHYLLAVKKKKKRAITEWKCHKCKEEVKLLLNNAS